MKKLLLLIILCSSSLGFAEDVVYVDSLVDAVALAENSKQDIVVVFTADWCKYCNKFKKEMNNNDVLKNKIVCYIDYDTNKDIIKEYMVSTIPDFMILRNKIEIKRKVGYNNKQDFIRWIQKDLD